MASGQTSKAPPKQYQCGGCGREYVHTDLGRISETEWRCYLCIADQRMKNVAEEGTEEEKARTRDDWITLVRAEIAKQKRQKHRARGQIFQEALSEVNAQSIEDGGTNAERKRAKQHKLMSLFNQKINNALARGFLTSTVFDFFSDFRQTVTAIAEHEANAQMAANNLEKHEKALDDFAKMMAGKTLSAEDIMRKRDLEQQLQDATAAVTALDSLHADSFVPCKEETEERRGKLLGPTGYLAYCDKGFWENQADQKGRDIMNIFYLRAKNDCGCYFASALWKYTGRYKCSVNWDVFQKLFPTDYGLLLEKYGDESRLRMTAEQSSALCGCNYRPYADGPGMMIEILVGEEWHAVASEVLPEEVMNRFAQAKADWLKLSTLTDEELWDKIIDTAVHPQTHLTDLIPGMSRKVLGVFPMKEWKAAGGQPITQKAWLKWFIAMAEYANTHCSDAKFPTLVALKQECERFCK